MLGFLYAAVAFGGGSSAARLLVVRGTDGQGAGELAAGVGGER